MIDSRTPLRRSIRLRFDGKRLLVHKHARRPASILAWNLHTGMR
ncbi:hypothetical protein [Stieleria mannarensis]|nr:hypothetical protein [Rhodopirellula sp. JC639]